MAELSAGPSPPNEIYVLVHVSQGSRYHYWVPKELGVPMLNKVIELPLPAAYGIVPATHHTDGEPLDTFVLTSEPPLPGSVIPARPVGLVRLEGGGRIDDKLIAVCSLDSEYQDIADIKDIEKRTLKQLEAAIKEDWVTRITWLDAARAKKAIERAIELHKKGLG